MKKLIVILCCLQIVVSGFSQKTSSHPLFNSGWEFVRYAAALTNKARLKICYVPTTSADNVNNINYWYDVCGDLPVEPPVLSVWVSSRPKVLSTADGLAFLKYSSCPHYSGTAEIGDHSIRPGLSGRMKRKSLK
jgi:hypothetical protein